MKMKIVMLVIFCVTTVAFARGPSRGNLDRTINAQGQFLLEQIPQNSILAIVGISSGSEELSRYVTENLTSHIVNNNNKNIRIVERNAMPLLQQELEFQYSGDVDDDFIVSLGRMIGANTVIAGTIYSIGSELHFNIRAIDIETSVIVASNGMNFRSDNRVRNLLHGGDVQKTLSQENIPVRHRDGSVSRANIELRENRQQAIRETREGLRETRQATGNAIVDFFSKEYFDREGRWTVGLTYYPEFPFGVDIGYLRNGLGLYFTFNWGLDALEDLETYQYTYVGETLRLANVAFGITYPLHFDWLWLSAAMEIPNVSMATSVTPITETLGLWEIEDKFGFGLSFGAIVSIKRFYFTARYVHLFDFDLNNNFMLGVGLNF